MELIKEIGRYKFSILSVIAIIAQDDGNFEFVLPHNVRFTLNADEKRQYDQALEFHNQVMQVYGMCKSAGLRA